VRCEPFAFTAAKLSKILKIESPLNWNTISEILLLAGHQIGEAELLFAKIEDEEIQKHRQTNKTANKEEIVVPA
jgi:methionyl-tRNA synthetase